MTKIEVLTELLTEELSEFKKDINKFEKLAKFFNNTIIKTDVSEFKKISKKFNDDQKLLFESQIAIQRTLSKEFSLEKSYPNWLLGLFSGVLILFLSFSTYAFYSIQRHESDEYKKGKQLVEEHFQNFMNTDPAVLKKYDNWKQNNIK